MTSPRRPWLEHYPEIVLSATEISQWRLCQRKWAYNRVEPIERPEQHASAALGSEVHRQLEAWLKRAERPTSRIAEAAIAHLPVPKAPGMLVEHQGWLRTDAATYQVRIDVTWPGHVWDHKTTGQLALAHTPETLRTDVQATLYGAWALWHYGIGIDSVEVTFGYLPTKSAPKCVPVTAVLSRSDIEKNLDDIDATAVEIVNAYRMGVGAKDLPSNPRACECYGGCPYFGGVCQLTMRERMRSYSMASILEQMKARVAASTTTAPVVVAPPPVATVTEAAVAVIGAHGLNPPPATTPAPSPPVSVAAAPAPSPPISVMATPAPEKRGPGRPPKKREESTAATVVTASPVVVNNAPSPADDDAVVPYTEQEIRFTVLCEILRSESAICSIPRTDGSSTTLPASDINSFLDELMRGFEEKRSST